MVGWSGTIGRISGYGPPLWADITPISATIIGPGLTITCTQSPLESSTHDHVLNYTGGGNVTDIDLMPLPALSLTAPKPIAIAATGQSEFTITYDADLMPFDVVCPPIGPVLDYFGTLTGDPLLDLGIYSYTRLRTTGPRDIIWNLLYAPPPQTGYPMPSIWSDVGVYDDIIQGTNGLYCPSVQIDPTPAMSAVLSITFDLGLYRIAITYDRPLTPAALVPADWTLIYPYAEAYYLASDCALISIVGATITWEIGAGDEVAGPARASYSGALLPDGTPQLVDFLGLPVLKFTDFPVV